VVLLVLTGMLMRNCVFLAEQPSSSLFELHPRWQTLMDVLGDRCYKMHMFMQTYGGSSPKATVLYSNVQSVADELWKPFQRSANVTTVTTVHRRTESGVEKVTGAPDLKGTQAYPPEFGRAVGRAMARFWAVVQRPNGVPVSLLPVISLSDDLWEDADLPSVHAALSQLHSTAGSSPRAPAFLGIFGEGLR